MQFFRFLALIVALLLGSCGSAGDALLSLDFLSMGVQGSSQIDPIEITTSADASVAVELAVQADLQYSGDGVDFRAVLPESLFGDGSEAGVVYSKNNPNVVTSEGPFALSAGEGFTFYAVIRPLEDSGDCTTATAIKIATIPDSDFVQVYIRACPPGS